MITARAEAIRNAEVGQGIRGARSRQFECNSSAICGSSGEARSPKQDNCAIWRNRRGNDGAVFTRFGSVDVAMGWPLRYSHSPRSDRYARFGCTWTDRGGCGEKLVKSRLHESCVRAHRRKHYCLVG